MDKVKQTQLNILTKGQKVAQKSEAQKAEISAQKAHRDQVMKATLAFINDEVATNVIRGMVEDFSQKGFQSYNYYVNTDDFEADLAGGVIPLPDDLENPTHWDSETRTQVPTEFTINGSLRSKSLRTYVQEILDRDFPGFTIRIFAEDFQDEAGDPAKFTIKLTNPSGASKKKKGGKGKGSRGGKGGGKGETITAVRTLEEFEAEKAKTQNNLNK